MCFLQRRGANWILALGPGAENRVPRGACWDPSHWACSPTLDVAPWHVSQLPKRRQLSVGGGRESHPKGQRKSWGGLKRLGGSLSWRKDD